METYHIVSAKRTPIFFMQVRSNRDRPFFRKLSPAIHSTTNRQTGLHYENLHTVPSWTAPAFYICRRFVMSRSGGAPNRRLYSRLNWEGLS